MPNQDLTNATFRARRILAAVLAVALLLRVGFAVTRDRWPASTDEAHWESLALMINEVGILSPLVGTYRPPLYALFVAASYAVFGADEFPVRALQALLGTATCGLVFLVGRRLGGTPVGLTAAAVAAVYPLLVFFSGVMMAESLLVFLTTASVLLAVTLEQRPTYVRAVALGATLGLAVLCKPVVLAWVPLLLALLWLRPSGPMGRVDRLNRLAAVVCAGLVVLMPWAVRNRIVTGENLLVSSNLGVNLMVGYEPEANGAYRDGRDYEGMFEALSAGEENQILKDRRVARIAVGWALADPVRTLGLAARKGARLWSPFLPGQSRFLNTVSFLTVGPVILLGIWGLVGGTGDPKTRWAIGLMAVAFTLAHAVVFSHARFRLPVDAVLLVPAAERAAFLGGVVVRLVRKRWQELLDGC